MIEQIKQHVFQQKYPVFQFFFYMTKFKTCHLLSLPIPFLQRVLSRAINIDQEKIENFWESLKHSPLFER